MGQWDGEDARDDEENEAAIAIGSGKRLPSEYMVCEGTFQENQDLTALKEQGKYVVEHVYRASWKLPSRFWLFEYSAHDTSTTTVRGVWSGGSIGIRRELLHGSWESALDTMLHEMAHALASTSNDDHGPVWASCFAALKTAARRIF